MGVFQNRGVFPLRGPNFVRLVRERLLRRLAGKVLITLYTGPIALISRQILQV